MSGSFKHSMWLQSASRIRIVRCMGNESYYSYSVCDCYWRCCNYYYCY